MSVDCNTCEDGNTVVYAVDVTVMVFLGCGSWSPNVQKETGAVSALFCGHGVSDSCGWYVKDTALVVMVEVSLAAEGALVVSEGSSVD